MTLSADTSWLIVKIFLGLMFVLVVIGFAAILYAIRVCP